MLKTTIAVLSSLLIVGCAATPIDKTPRTTTGRLNSCMLGEIYGWQESGKLSADEWTAAQEALRLCMRRLNLNGDDINAASSLNIAASAVRSLRQASERATKK